MKQAFLFSSGITAIVVGVFALAYLTSAATTKYKFTGEGTVQEYDANGNNLRVYFTKISKKAEAVALGKAKDVRLGGARIYARDANDKLKRIKAGNIPIGTRVSVAGAVKSDDSLAATRVERLKNTFTMEGKLETYSSANRDLTITVKKTNYKSARYLNKTVRFIFPPAPATKFYSRGVEKQADQVVANSQTIEVKGEEVGTDLEVTWMNELP